MQKSVLLVLPSSTYRTRAFMYGAAAEGVELVVASDHRQAMSALVPDTTLALNFRKPATIPARVREFAANRRFDAVVGVDDNSVYIAALIAEALGLPHNPLPAVMAARNKLKMREKIAPMAINSPAFQKLPLKKNPKRLAKSLNFPCVLKPLFLSASRGVTRVDTPEEFIAAFESLKKLISDPDVAARAYNDEAKYILAEDYIPGIEVAVEGLLLNGEFKSLAIFDKPDPLEGPHFIETIYVTPSRLPGYVQREVIHAAHQAALAIGLRNGPVHAEARINEEGVWVVEVAARSIGGLCSRALRFTHQMSLEALILRQATGGDVQAIQRERQASAVMMMPVLDSGILKEVQGIPEAAAVEGIEDVLITIPYGQSLLPMPVGGRYLGFIFARAEQPEDAETAIREAYSRLKVITE